MGEEGGVFRGSQAIDDLLGECLVHHLNLENGRGEVEHGTAYLREVDRESKIEG